MSFEAMRVWITGSLFGLLWLVFSLVIIAGLVRYLFWGPWLMQIGLIRRIDQRCRAFWARIASRREMERELRARTANPRDSRARYNLGVVYMRQHRWAKAAEELQASVEVNPDRADAHWRLGECLFQMGRADEAIVSLRTCLEHRPDHFDTQLLLGRIYVEGERFPEARQVLESFLERHADDVEAWFRMGQVELADGHPEAAVERFGGTLMRARQSARPNRARDRRLARQARAKLRDIARGQ